MKEYYIKIVVLYNYNDLDLSAICSYCFKSVKEALRVISDLTTLGVICTYEEYNSLSVDCCDIDDDIMKKFF